MDLPKEITPELATLARLNGVELDSRLTGSAILEVLMNFEPSLDLSDVPAALREFRLKHWSTPLAPVYVLWEGEAQSLAIRIPAHAAEQRIPFHLRTEGGEVGSWTLDLAGLFTQRSKRIGKDVFLKKEFRVSRRLPRGYHRLEMEWGGEICASLLIVAPPKVFSGPQEGPTLSLDLSTAVPLLPPNRIREEGYAFFRERIQQHAQFKSTLLLSRVTALHRRLWIPVGLSRAEGVYVRYAPEEFYSILCVESYRRQSPFLGEDPGTTSEEVRLAMIGRGLLPLP